MAAGTSLHGEPSEGNRKVGINWNGRGRACPGASRLPSRHLREPGPARVAPPGPGTGSDTSCAPGPRMARDTGCAPARGCRDSPGSRPWGPGECPALPAELICSPGALAKALPVSRARGRSRCPGVPASTRSRGPGTAVTQGHAGPLPGPGPRENRQAAGTGDLGRVFGEGEPWPVCARPHTPRQRGPLGFETCETFLRALRNR